MKRKQLLDWKKIKKSWETKLTLPLGLLLVSVFCLVLLTGVAFYLVGGNSAEVKIHQQAKSKLLQDNRDSFVENNTLSEAFDIVLKQFLSFLGQYAHVVLVLIGASWLIHGVGFRLL